jgi:protein-disulfide isomerase
VTRAQNPATSRSKPEGLSLTPATAIAKIGDEIVTLEAIQPDIAFQVYRQQLDIYLLIEAALKSLVERRLLEREAQSRGISTDELARAVQDAAKPATDADVDAYLAATPEAASEPNARERIAYYLTERARIQARLDLVEALRERTGFQVLIEPPTQPRARVVTDGIPARGPADAAVHVVHFASLTSVRSARSAQQLERLDKAFPGRIRFYHRSLPADGDEIGLAAAQLAAGAAEQGKFWEIHDHVLALQGVVRPADLERVAAEAGVPAVRPGELVHLDAVRRDVTEARRIGIESEPVAFVNGRYYSPTFPYEQLQALVEEELGRRGTAARATGASSALH